MSTWIMNYYHVVIALILLRFAPLSNCKYVEGTLQTLEDWEFITRFCFLSEQGRLEFEFRIPNEFNNQQLLFYYDTPDQWPAVYKVEMPCTNKTSPPYIWPENNQVITLSSASSTCQRDVSRSMMTCHDVRRFRTARPRWWYIAMSHCRPQYDTGINVNYKIWMTNGNDLFHKHFSADEFYILEVDIAFLVAIFLLFILSIVVAVKLREQQMFHSTYKLYMVSLFFELCSLFIMCIGYGKYANDGLDMFSIKTFGQVLESISVLIFILLLILVGKGFTITRGRISTSGSIKLTVFMCVYCIVYAVLFIYQAEFFDPGLVLYLYESPAGYGLIALRIIAWVWFCYAIFFTLKHFKNRNKFYFSLFVFYTCWFWLGPVIILVANFGIEKQNREGTVNGINCAVSFCGFGLYLFLTRPSNANKNFPYHLRTSQIGILDETSTPNTSRASSPPAVINNNDYGPNFTELFTVSAPLSYSQRPYENVEIKLDNGTKNPFQTSDAHSSVQ